MYGLMGMLAVGVATGVGGRATDPSGVLEEIGAQPFGLVLLGLVALGLTGYALWRLVQALADPDRKAGTCRASRGVSDIVLAP